MTTNPAPGRTGLRRLSHNVGVIWLAAVILAAPGCGKKSPPSPANASEASNSGWKLDLKVAPERPRIVRPATFAVHIADTTGKPVENAQVTGALTMTMMDMGKTAVKFGPKGNGDYQATVPSFDMSGPWDLTVDAAQGPLHSRRVFQVTVFD